MSCLSLLQGYSSTEEQEETYLSSSSSSDEEENDEGLDNNRNDFKRKKQQPLSLFDPPTTPSSSSSSLPSALVAFSEVSRPPQFLNNSVGDSPSADKDNDAPRHGRRRYHRDKYDVPAGAVMQAKAQLVGIRDRVSSDASNISSADSAKRLITATNPNAQDAADLLRMCVPCGIPKTFSNARGMVCPVCGDRPIKETDESLKKKGSMIKDKEKNKRMKGQSSHSTWKSETEMHLRQQFD